MVTEAFNETKGVVLATHVQRADNLWSRFWGLMFRKALPDSHALHIIPCSSVHTFFMRFDMDAVFLDRDSTVVKVVPAMKPYRAATGGKGAHSVVEMAAGSSANAQVETGDRLVFRD